MNDSLDGLYQQVILDHARLRSGYGSNPHPDAERFARNPSCGDEITLQLTVEPGGDRIASVVWSGSGCSISLASASILSQLSVGLTVVELQTTIDAFRAMMHSRGATDPDERTLGDAVVLQGVSKYVMRVKCAMLAWVALEGCLEDLT